MAKTDLVFKEYLAHKKVTKNHELYVLHLVGSHGAYHKRYIKEMVMYKEPKNPIEDYDNTIYFTDIIVHEIMDFFIQENQKVLIVYMSDHGEVVSVNRSGHGFSASYKDEYDVPLVVYSTIENSRIEESFKQNLLRPLNLESFNYFIKYISGLSDESNLSYSSKVFSVSPEHVLDYNELKYISEEE